MSRRGISLRPSQPALSRALQRALGASLGASGIIQLLTIATGIVLARSLGPHGRGELAALLLWPAVLTALGSLGVPEAVTYFTARRAAPLKTIVGTTLIVCLLQSVVLIAVGAAIVPLAFTRFDATTRSIAYLALAYAQIYLLALYLTNILNGLQRYVAFQALRLLVYINTLSFLVVIVLAERMVVVYALIANLAAHLFVGLVALVLVLRATDMRLSFDRVFARQMIAFGIRSHLHNVSTALNERLDQLMISLFLSPASLGMYVIAVTLTSATSLVGSSIAMVALPTVANLPTPEARAAAARRFIGITAAISVLVTIPMIAVAPELISFFFGPAFAPVANVARVLLGAGALLSLNRSIAAVLTALGRPLDAGLAESAGLAVTIAALLVLLPIFGLMGAAVASFAAYAFTLLWMLRRVAGATRLAAPTRSEAPALATLPAQFGAEA
jgi:O-antigen/teichoic acid export membrane protein